MLAYLAGREPRQHMVAMAKAEHMVMAQPMSPHPMSPQQPMAAEMHYSTPISPVYQQRHSANLTPVRPHHDARMAVY